MAVVRRMMSNFSRGELAPQIEGRPDLAAFFNGCSILENFWIFYEGGVFRRYGMAFINETKDSTKFSILIPFKFNIEQAYFIEAGHLYFRFYRRGLSGSNRLKRIETSAGTPIEIVTPYTETDLKELQWAGLADVLYFAHPNYQPRRLSRVSDTSWVLALHVPNPGPSSEIDEPITVVGGPSANIGTIKLRTPTDYFLAADVGRQIIAGAGKATIIALDTARQVSATVIDSFAATITAGPNTLTSVGTAVTSTAHGLAVNNLVVLTSGAQSGELRVVTVVGGVDVFTVDAAFSLDQSSGVTWNKIVGFAANAWSFRGSPQTTLDVDAKLAGSAVNIAAGANAFRSSYVGKFFKLYGGTIEATTFTSATAMVGKGITTLAASNLDNPAIAIAGSWTLETLSWSDARGWPNTVEFHQGRLAYGGTLSQPTTWWESATDSFDNFATGSEAADGLQYTIASRSVNTIEWLKSLKHLFIGDAETERNARGPGIDQPLGGDVIPFVSDDGDDGSMSTMSLAIQRAVIFIQTFGRKIIGVAYDLNDDAFTGVNLCTHARHIGGLTGFRQHPPVYQKEPNYLTHFLRNDGQVASLTLLRKEQVNGWSRMITDGGVESVCAIPDKYHGKTDLGFVVKRTINGATKRYIEISIGPEDTSTTLLNRLWREYYTDCGKDGTILAAATTITGLSHLEAKTVDIVIGDSFREQVVVSSGVATLSEAVESDSTYEVGLHYKSKLRTMRPAIPDRVIQGLTRGWKKVCLLLLNSIGGTVNGNNIDYPPAPLSGPNPLRTGPFKIDVQDEDLDGYLTVEQDQPYPFQLLNIAGSLHVGDD